jgi:hypothetical protein
MIPSHASVLFPDFLRLVHADVFERRLHAYHSGDFSMYSAHEFIFYVHYWIDTLKLPYRVWGSGAKDFESMAASLLIHLRSRAPQGALSLCGPNHLGQISLCSEKGALSPAD